MSDTTNVDRIMRGLHEVAAIVQGKGRPTRVQVPVGIDVKALVSAKD